MVIDMPPEAFRLYAGDGSTIEQRGLELPSFERSERLDDPRHYLAEPGLQNAVNVALTLGRPLLLTGEPGTGKTQLASSVAYQLGLRLLPLTAKTTSTARDLFYRYDALRHFQDANVKHEAVHVDNYIEFEALGLAILLAMKPDDVRELLPGELRDQGPVRSVVLIDEIDKAPRDLPNDVLSEIEQMSFTVKETGRHFSAEPRFHPIVILTSNSEKNLPEAFLRRCVFYHIAFPEPARLQAIIEARLEPNAFLTPARLAAAIRHFDEVRRLRLTKPPATAECLDWLAVLQRLQIDVSDVKALTPGQVEALAFSYCLLAKTKDDLARIQHDLRTRLGTG
jgi:MoxR-like ATPase